MSSEAERQRDYLRNALDWHREGERLEAALADELAMYLEGFVRAEAAESRVKDGALAVLARYHKQRGA